jgi:hypothetical protein
MYLFTYSVILSCVIAVNLFPRIDISLLEEKNTLHSWRTLFSQATPPLGFLFVPCYLG